MTSSSCARYSLELIFLRHTISVFFAPLQNSVSACVRAWRTTQSTWCVTYCFRCPFRARYGYAGNKLNCNLDIYFHLAHMPLNHCVLSVPVVWFLTLSLQHNNATTIHPLPLRAHSSLHSCAGCRALVRQEGLCLGVGCRCLRRNSSAPFAPPAAVCPPPTHSHLFHSNNKPFC